ncbi:hypothetical protein [Nonomuraea sp. CA-141351]|uniref:hypothetical protein n=1 Tax=Nonomuraea sp. CA-141351 TaxID=3239996 RepID=UPI003D8B9B05
MANAVNSLAKQLANQANAVANTGIPPQVAVAGGGAGLLAFAIIGGVTVIILRARKANKRRRKHAAPSETPQTSGDAPTETIPNP